VSRNERKRKVPVWDHVKRKEKGYLETEGIINLEVDRLITSLGGSVRDFTDTEVEDDARSDDRLSEIEDLV
jgi:hypothetical protein